MSRPAAEPDEKPIEVRVTRYVVQRTKLAQALVPIGIGAGVLARRFPGLLSPYVVFGFYALVLALLLSAIKRLGWQSLQVEAGGILLGKELRVRRDDVTCWAHHRELARLYGPENSFVLAVARSRGEAAGQLEAQLTQVFGQPLPLQPRGSLRARRIALSLAALGLLVGLSGIMGANLVALFVGMPLALTSVAVFGALSQRVARLP